MAIHEAWRVYKILSLVSLDVQGAFNGVHPSVLAERLRERRVPGDLVAWIESFCNGRKASVVVGDYDSPLQDIEHAGIPQGSPLSSILYVFYNANLVQGAINTREGFCLSECLQTVCRQAWHGSRERIIAVINPSPRNSALFTVKFHRKAILHICISL